MQVNRILGSTATYRSPACSAEGVLQRRVDGGTAGWTGPTPVMELRRSSLLSVALAADGARSLAEVGGSVRFGPNWRRATRNCVLLYGSSGTQEAALEVFRAVGRCFTEVSQAGKQGSETVKRRVCELSGELGDAVIAWRWSAQADLRSPS